MLSAQQASARARTESNTMHDQLLMGLGITTVSLVGISRHRWLLANTRKGQALVRQCGEPTARYLWWMFCAVCAGFGGLLASGIVRPMTW
jgi:hypothetical protein